MNCAANQKPPANTSRAGSPTASKSLNEIRASRFDILSMPGASACTRQRRLPGNMLAQAGSANDKCFCRFYSAWRRKGGRPRVAGDRMSDRLRRRCPREQSNSLRRRLGRRLMIPASPPIQRMFARPSAGGVPAAIAPAQYADAGSWLWTYGKGCSSMRTLCSSPVRRMSPGLASLPSNLPRRPAVQIPPELSGQSRQSRR